MLFYRPGWRAAWCFSKVHVSWICPGIRASVDTVLHCKRKQWPFSSEHGSVLSSCTGIGFPLCPEIRLSTWTHSHTKAQRLMILVIAFGIKIQEISHLHTCCGQIWSCSFHGTASQLCRVLDYCWGSVPWQKWSLQLEARSVSCQRRSQIAWSYASLLKTIKDNVKVF